MRVCIPVRCPIGSILARFLLPLAAALLVLAAPAEGAPYVALGDSYSSGEGLPPYAPGSNTWRNQCHRSYRGYAWQLAAARGHRRFTFAACSGATTNDLFSMSHNYRAEGSQLDALGPDTQVVTLTIGGNDLGLTNWLQACLTFAPRARGAAGPSVSFPGRWGCIDDPLLQHQTSAALAALAGTGTAILRTLTPESPGTLLGRPRRDPDSRIVPIRSVEEVLRAIAGRAPRARIFLAGYPSPFGADPARYVPNPHNRVSGLQCELPRAIGITYDYRDAQGANALQTAYTAIQRGAVDAVRADGIDATFVDAQAAFAGHGNCDTGRTWINPIHRFPFGSFHPTPAGQSQGYRRAFLDAGF